jgi:hypothetical protein
MDDRAAALGAVDAAGCRPAGADYDAWLQGLGGEALLRGSRSTGRHHMKRISRSFRPGDSALEPRALLSAASAAEVARPSFTGTFPGRVAGRYVAPHDNRPVDEPVKVGLDGFGRVWGLGRVRVTGDVSFGGFVPVDYEDVNGTITLSNPRGSVTLRVHGFGGNATIPGGQFETSVNIEGGAGAYRRLNAFGTAVFRFGGTTAPDGSMAGPVHIQLRLTPRVFGGARARPLA